MRTRLILAVAVVEVLLFGLYANSLSPSPSTCAGADDGEYVKIRGFVEERSKNSFVLNDGTGRIVVLGAAFEKGNAVIAEGRAFVRGGTKFLDCDRAEIVDESGLSVSMRDLAENPEKYVGRIVEVAGRVERGSSSWFVLESEGYEAIVLSGAKTSGRVMVTGSFFYDTSDMRYKLRAIEVGSPVN